jgi:hypothetical protein
MAIAAVIAVLDWWAVATDRRDIERWAKPAVMVFLIAAAVLIPAESDWIRWWIVIGLAFGLVGDVLLFADRFIPGLRRRASASPSVSPHAAHTRAAARPCGVRPNSPHSVCGTA